MTQRLILALFLMNVGCAKKQVAAAPPAPPYQGIVGSETSRLQESLFKGDQEVLSNEDIQRILTARITLDDRRRLAVLGLAPRYTWSQALADLEIQNSERFLQDLRSSPQLTEVRMMPTLLIPEKRTVPYLREAAARFQADLLLVYATRVQTFQQDRLIGADEVRAGCTAEAVLLDVRTGIVTHTAQTAERIATRKSPGDLNFSETVTKAQSEATGKALLKLADAVVAYLKDASGQGPGNHAVGADH